MRERSRSFGRQIGRLVAICSAFAAMVALFCAIAAMPLSHHPAYPVHDDSHTVRPSPIDEAETNSRSEKNEAFTIGYRDDRSDARASFRAGRESWDYGPRPHREAQYLRGADTDTLLFGYTVAIVVADSGRRVDTSPES